MKSERPRFLFIFKAVRDWLLRVPHFWIQAEFRKSLFLHTIKKISLHSGKAPIISNSILKKLFNTTRMATFPAKDASIVWKGSFAVLETGLVGRNSYRTKNSAMVARTRRSSKTNIGAMFVLFLRLPLRTTVLFFFPSFHTRHHHGSRFQRKLKGPPGVPNSSQSYLARNTTFVVVILFRDMLREPKK